MFAILLDQYRTERDFFMKIKCFRWTFIALLSTTALASPTPSTSNDTQSGTEPKNLSSMIANAHHSQTTNTSAPNKEVATAQTSKLIEKYMKTKSSHFTLSELIATNKANKLPDEQQKVNFNENKSKIAEATPAPAKRTKILKEMPHVAMAAVTTPAPTIKSEPISDPEPETKIAQSKSELDEDVKQAQKALLSIKKTLPTEKIAENSVVHAKKVHPAERAMAANNNAKPTNTAKTIASIAQTKVKVQPKIQAQAKAKVQTQVQTKVTAQAKPKIHTQVQTKVTAQMKPKIQTQVQSKVAVQAKPKGQVQVQTKVVKVTAQVKPKIETQAQPKIQAQAKPKAQIQAQTIQAEVQPTETQAKPKIQAQVQSTEQAEVQPKAHALAQLKVQTQAYTMLKPIVTKQATTQEIKIQAMPMKMLAINNVVPLKAEKKTNTVAPMVKVAQIEASASAPVASDDAEKNLTQPRVATLKKSEQTHHVKLDTAVTLTVKPTVTKLAALTPSVSHNTQKNSVIASTTQSAPNAKKPVPMNVKPKQLATNDMPKHIAKKMNEDKISRLTHPHAYEPDHPIAQQKMASHPVKVMIGHKKLAVRKVNELYTKLSTQALTIPHELPAETRVATNKNTSIIKVSENMKSPIVKVSAIKKTPIVEVSANEDEDIDDDMITANHPTLRSSRPVTSKVDIFPTAEVHPRAVAKAMPKQVIETRPEIVSQVGPLPVMLPGSRVVVGDPRNNEFFVLGTGDELVVKHHSGDVGSLEAANSPPPIEPVASAPVRTSKVVQQSPVSSGLTRRFALKHHLFTHSVAAVNPPAIHKEQRVKQNDFAMNDIDEPENDLAPAPKSKPLSTANVENKANTRDIWRGEPRPQQSQRNNAWMANNDDSEDSIDPQHDALPAIHSTNVQHHHYSEHHAANVNDQDESTENSVIPPTHQKIASNAPVMNDVSASKMPNNPFTFKRQENTSDDYAVYHVALNGKSDKAKEKQTAPQMQTQTAAINKQTFAMNTMPNQVNRLITEMPGQANLVEKKAELDDMNTLNASPTSHVKIVEGPAEVG